MALIAFSLGVSIGLAGCVAIDINIGSGACAMFALALEVALFVAQWC